MLLQLWNTFHAKEYVSNAFINSRIQFQSDCNPQVKPSAARQLKDWGIDYFDLYLIHFPIALQYVDPVHRYPAGWLGDDDKVHLRKAPESLRRTFNNDYF